MHHPQVYIHTETGVGVEESREYYSAEGRGHARHRHLGEPRLG